MRLKQQRDQEMRDLEHLLQIKIRIDNMIRPSKASTGRLPLTTLMNKCGRSASREAWSNDSTRKSSSSRPTWLCSFRWSTFSTLFGSKISSQKWIISNNYHIESRLLFQIKKKLFKRWKFKFDVWPKKWLKWKIQLNLKLNAFIDWLELLPRNDFPQIFMVPLMLTPLKWTEIENREKFDFLMDKAHNRTENGHATNQTSSVIHQSETTIATNYTGRFELDLIRNTDVQTFQVDGMISDGAQGRIYFFHFESRWSAALGT